MTFMYSALFSFYLFCAHSGRCALRGLSFLLVLPVEASHSTLTDVVELYAG